MTGHVVGHERFRFHPYEETAEEALPNIVVDGSPNPATVLTLTHWPGIGQPSGLGADLSAQMAFAYLDQRPAHPPASFVTNNHFDQDGLVGIHALVEPDLSLAHRDELIDVAACGDFATYRFRQSARASMVIWAYAQQDLSPLGSAVAGPYPEVCATLYETMLPLLVPLIQHPDRFKELWHDEDQQLTAAEAALSDEQVTISEVGDVDLAVVRIDADLGLTGGHRFAADTAEFIHPMALHNATTASRLLLIRGREYRFLDRYETWVQYRSRSLPKRVDMAPLAEALTATETGGTTWEAGKPSTLVPRLRHAGRSSIAAPVVEEMVANHLRTAETAWDPFVI